MEDIKFLDQVKEKGNFWFMEIINQEIYDKLLDAERIARIDFKTCGIRAIRGGLECIIRYMLEDARLKKVDTKGMKLSEKINLLREESILPSIGIVKADFEDGRSGEIDYYDFLRRFGNACSHEEVRSYDIKVDYLQVYRCLKGLHLLVKKYYQKRISKDTPDFMPNYMPIGDYFIQEAYVPKDTLRSRCIVEFLAYSLDARDNRAFYAILRLYNKEELNENFILRNNDTFLEASKASITSVPEGMTRMEEVISYGDKSSFYMMGYLFNREAQQLTSRVLRDIDLRKRLMMCKRIADCFYNLHNSEVPIYHRMISDEAIFLCDFGREWVPYVIQIHNALVPMSVSNKLIMLGDHKQIPPTRDEELLDLCQENGVDSELLEMSLFEMVYDEMPEENKIMLDTQYRMPGEIADTISEWFYQDNYLSADFKRDMESKIPKLSKKPFLLIDTSEEKNRHERRIEKAGSDNNLEANIVRDLVSHISLEAQINLDEVGVISAYKSQVKLIKSKLKEKFSEEAIKEMVATLDSFQGQERDLIIYSFTKSSKRSGKSKRIGFLNELRRLNVAMTRCKEMLILIGDMDFLSSCEHMEEDDYGDPQYDKSEKEFSDFINKMLKDLEDGRGERISYGEFTNRIRGGTI